MEGAARSHQLVRCKYCKGDYTKLAKSHVIPKAFYGPLFSSQADKDIPRLVHADASEFPKRSRVGAYDTEILCQDCESGIFSSLDDFAFKALFETQFEQKTDGSNVSYLSCNDVDLERLRLFFASLLWRMHWSKLPIFKNVKLGSHMDSVTKALKLNDIKYASQIDVVISKFEDPLSEILMGPSKLKIKTSIGNLNGYRINFSKMACWVKIDQRQFVTPFSSTSIGRSDKLIIVQRDFLDGPEFRAARDAAKANKKFRW